MKEALYYEKQSSGKVQCYLCPHNCLINDDKRGICKVRKNIGGSLFAESYGKLCSLGFDPIEKKPLYHFFPGQPVLSIGTVGCNMHCTFCQNCEISQTTVEELPVREYTADEIINVARSREDNLGIAYTYNEPAIWYEYLIEVAERASYSGLKNAMVTNGFISEEPLDRLLNFMDAFNVDLKAFNENFYKKQTGASLRPVLRNLKTIKEGGKHLEITNLVITDLNDDEGEFIDMVKWIERELGKDTVLHISRYFPMYKLSNPPTLEETMERFHYIARQHLDYAYLGNLHSGNNQVTKCSSCGKVVMIRNGYGLKSNGLDNEGKCLSCKNQIVIKS